jgi:hypothetical protein
MRRILLLLAGALALALAVPGAAVAHHGHHRHHHHHHHHHHGHLKHFGGEADHVHPGTPNAGTVASFADGTLTITLADGSSASGKVTDGTVINCLPAVQAPPTAAAAHDRGRDDDEGDDPGDDHRGDFGDRGQAACDASDLVPGAAVHVAILKLGAGGAEFKLVLLDQRQDR